MTAPYYDASEMRALAEAYRATQVPLTRPQVEAKYALVFQKIYAAASQGLNLVNIKLTAAQYEEFAPVIQYHGYGIGPALPSNISTVATNITGISFTGQINNGASAASSGNVLIVTSAPDAGLAVGIPVQGSGVTTGTYITSTTIDGTIAITGGNSGTHNFTASTTSGSNQLTGVVDFTNIAVDSLITGPGIPSDTVVSEIQTGSGKVIMSKQATATSAGIQVSFSIFTVFTTAVPAWPTGTQVKIEGCTPGQYNGVWTVASSASTTQFTVTPDYLWTNPTGITVNGTVKPSGLGAAGWYTVNNSQLKASSTLTSTWITVENSQGIAENGKIVFQPTPVTTRAYASATNGEISVDSTDGLYVGMEVRFTGSVSLGGIVPYRVYYVKTAVNGLLTVTEVKDSATTKTWSTDTVNEMSVQAGGVFTGISGGQTYYVSTVPDAYHVVISREIGGAPLPLTSQTGYMSVTADTTAADLAPAVPIYTGPDSIGSQGNDYVISWIV